MIQHFRNRMINQLDENPCFDKNIKEHAQYQHGGVNVSGEKTTAELVYRVVNCEKSYNIENDAMLVECMPGFSHIIKGMIGVDYIRFHEFLKTNSKIDYCRSNSYSNHAN